MATKTQPIPNGAGGRGRGRKGGKTSMRTHRNGMVVEGEGYLCDFLSGGQDRKRKKAAFSHLSLLTRCDCSVCSITVV